MSDRATIAGAIRPFRTNIAYSSYFIGRGRRELNTATGGCEALALVSSHNKQHQTHDPWVHCSSLPTLQVQVGVACQGRWAV